MKKLVLNALGFVSLVLGAMGVILPGLPTTPFVILAAMCFSKSNPRLYNRLAATRFFGPYIQHYRTRRGISWRLKIISICVVWLSLCLSMFLLQMAWAYVILSFIGICVSVHIALIKTGG